MATNNAINSNIPIAIAQGGTNATSFATTDGTVYYDGTRLVTTATGNSGDRLTSNGTGVAPTYKRPSGTVLQQPRTTSSTLASTTTLLAPTSTPTTSNTTLLTSLTLTPANTSNILLFDFSAVAAGSIGVTTTAGGVSFFLFQGTTLKASFSGIAGSSREVNTITFRYQQTAGTTSSTTYYIYYAYNESSGTAYINSTSSGSGYSFGNSYQYTLIITEVTP